MSKLPHSPTTTPQADLSPAQGDSGAQGEPGVHARGRLPDATGAGAQNDETDGGLKDARSRPIRTCIVTRSEQPIDHLIRFVRAPDGTVVADLGHRLPGRGVWITAQARLILQAADKKLFSRAFKAQTSAPEGLVAGLGVLLRQRALQSLALANKAGTLVAGFEKVDAQVSKGLAVVLISASDGSGDGIGKLISRVNGVAADGGPRPMHVTLFTSEELSLSAGRSRVIHACLARGGASAAFLRECTRLLNFQSGELSAGKTADLGHVLRIGRRDQ